MLLCHNESSEGKLMINIQTTYNFAKKKKKIKIFMA